LTTSRPGGPWLAEEVWLTPASGDLLFGYTPEEASAGGVSLTYAIPSWQQGISMTANQGSTTMRNLPDVSLVANNVDVVFGNDYLGSSLDYPASGTSLATPLWAAFTALVNEQAAANRQPPIGFLNPALYAIGKSTNYHSCFHDITYGNNFTASSPTKYAATAGYDLCTGWGTLNGSNMLKALLAPPSESLVITPPFGFASFGPASGPYSETSRTFTLTNSGANPVNWNLVSTANWLTASSTGGTLNPGGPVSTVTVSLNSNATKFLIENCSGNVTFVNQTDGTFQNREFDLYSGNGGFETGDLTDWIMVGASDLNFALAGDDVDIGGTNALFGEADNLFVHSGLYGAYLGQFPTGGSLSQAIPTTPGQQYLVSYWLTSVPFEGSTLPNDFAAYWDGLTLYSETNLDDFGWTNMIYTVPATATSTTLEFTFNNTPAGFGLDDITVEPVPTPNLQSIVMSGGNVLLAWTGFPNLSYQVQCSGSLSNPDWTNIGAPTTASTSIVTASEPVTSPSVQFYRVVLLLPPD
jgi:hypothetical protein